MFFRVEKTGELVPRPQSCDGKIESRGRIPKGLDFIARFNGKYVIGEAKFLTDFGGHKNAQFNDAIATIKAKNMKAIKVAILDGRHTP